jgi:transcriptional regulator with XRE-family HTH domain
MKNTNEIEGNDNFDDILNEASKGEKTFVTKSLQIATQINSILERKKMLQKDFAIKMGKSEAEISKWLSGFHNLTIKTIANIEAVLGETVIVTPLQFSNAPHAIEALISHINSPAPFRTPLDLNTRVDSKAIPIARVISMPHLTFMEVEFTEPLQNKPSYLPTGT